VDEAAPREQERSSIAKIALACPTVNGNGREPGGRCRYRFIDQLAINRVQYENASLHYRCNRAGVGLQNHRNTRLVTLAANRRTLCISTPNHKSSLIRESIVK
jgi:hypothetical protein